MTGPVALMLVALDAVPPDGQGAWGYSLAQTTNIGLASVYPILARFVSYELVTATKEEDRTAFGAKRTFYQLTPAGRELARGEAMAKLGGTVAAALRVSAHVAPPEAGRIHGEG